MQNRKTAYLVLLILFILIVILGVIISYPKRNDMRVVFLDVGQGDSILISQGSNQVLVDGGRSGQRLLEKLGTYVPFWDRSIETIIITHPDQDHIGGLLSVFENYEIKTVIMNDFESETKTFDSLKNLIEKEESEIVEGVSGLDVLFSNEAKLSIIYPFGSAREIKDANSASLVSVLKIGSFDFMLTGDIDSSGENRIVEKVGNLEAEVLKVSHHGSKYSTGEKFLEKVSPSQAIISVGSGNPYGHPAQDVLEKLRKVGAEIMRTDEMGDISYFCRPEKQCVLQ